MHRLYDVRSLDVGRRGRVRGRRAPSTVVILSRLVWHMRIGHFRRGPSAGRRDSYRQRPWRKGRQLVALERCVVGGGRWVFALFCRLRDQSLITGRGGGLQNGKIAGLELFVSPLKTGSTSPALPPPPPFSFLKGGHFLCPLQYG